MQAGEICSHKQSHRNLQVNQLLLIDTYYKIKTHERDLAKGLRQNVFY